MEAHICATCGVQHAPSGVPPARCPICDDDRQYVGPGGQRWTTPAELRAGRRNAVRPLDPGLTGIGTEPGFAIGQQAHLVETPAGNLLWDCVSLLDDATVAEVERRGGLAGIAVSHPHLFGAMVDWSRALGGVPIHLHADHRPWVVYPDEAVRYWEGDTFAPLPGLTLVRCGGHFPGSTALHWADGADGRGALFTSDTIYVASDRRWVSFMYSYPNAIPLDPASVRGVVAAVEPFAFDRIYGGWHGAVVQTDAKAAVRRSADRYLARITGTA